MPNHRSLSGLNEQLGQIEGGAAAGSPTVSRHLKGILRRRQLLGPAFSWNIPQQDCVWDEMRPQLELEHKPPHLFLAIPLRVGRECLFSEPRKTSERVRVFNSNKRARTPRALKIPAGILGSSAWQWVWSASEGIGRGLYLGMNEKESSMGGVVTPAFMATLCHTQPGLIHNKSGASSTDSCTVS
ncbi:fibroblast growth factor 16 [Lates japonicus]|uniref:Fibroblast growth factor 16 n=1 Tax=Lates japonicus TaxID=270547 RepID=A0AAD3R9E2_LATJO|nr:fibroblast growth factor 16 [Lates japonicus]